MKKISFLICFALITTSLQAGSFDSPKKASAGHTAQMNDHSGSITQINLQTRVIVIKQTAYVLSDDLKVFLPDNILVSQLVLAPGQTITFDSIEGNGSPIITKIVIQSGFDARDLPPS